MGATAAGLSHKQRKAIRNTCLTAAGVATRSWCTTAVARMLWSESADPVVEFPAALLRQWQRLMSKEASLRNLLGRAWGKKGLQRVARNPATRWRNVCGPTTAILAHCLDMGWPWHSKAGEVKTKEAEGAAVNLIYDEDLVHMMRDDLEKN